MKIKISESVVLLSFLLFLSISFPADAEKKNSSAKTETMEISGDPAIDENYVMASFPKGMKAYEKWFKNHIHYPKEAEANGTEENIIVKFTVTEEGEIKYPHVIEG